MFEGPSMLAVGVVRLLGGSLEVRADHRVSDLAYRRDDGDRQAVAGRDRGQADRDGNERDEGSRSTGHLRVDDRVPVLRRSDAQQRTARDAADRRADDEAGGWSDDVPQSRRHGTTVAVAGNLEVDVIAAPYLERGGTRR